MKEVSEPSSSSSNTKYFIGILLAAVALRLIALPFSNPVVADATSRIFIAWEWMEHPNLITSGGWLPLHFYLIAGSLWLWFDPLYSPVCLHIIFSIATAIPLWAFIRREWGESEALFVSAAYLLYPVCVRHSYMAEVHAPFLFFLALAMYFVSRARGNPNFTYPFLAGVSIALASALRYEGWLLIPLLALIFWRKWLAMLAFLIPACLFPISWLIGNLSHGGQPIAQLSAVHGMQLELNEKLGIAEVIRRSLYFPSVIFWGLTPLLCILCIWGIYAAFRHYKKQRVWLIPFFGLLLIFEIGAAMGLISTAQTRHSTILGLLLLPFSAEAFASIKSQKNARNIAILVLVAMLPFSYIRVILSRVAGPTFPNPFPVDLEAIPKIKEEPKTIARIVRAQFNERTDGLIIDFFRAEGFYGWRDTYYVALASGVRPSDLYIFPGNRYQSVDNVELTRILANHPGGLLLRSNLSREMTLIERNGGKAIQVRGTDHLLWVRPITSISGITLYRYSTMPTDG